MPFIPDNENTALRTPSLMAFIAPAKARRHEQKQSRSEVIS